MAKGNPTNAMTVRWMAVSGLLLVVGVSVGIWLGNQGLSWNNGPEDRAAQKFKEFIGIVSDDYVHPVAVDSLMEVTLNAVLGRLDPHSVYLPEDEAVQLEEELAGRYEGIGIEYRMVRDTVAVVASRGPARRAGLRPGDRLLGVDGISIVGWPTDSLVGALKGPATSSVDLEVWSPISNSRRIVQVKRAAIAVPSIRASRLDSGKVGYLQIMRFGEHTASEVRSALRQLREEKIGHLVLDLRGNGGGFLSAGVAVADEFLSDGKIIVWTQARGEGPVSTVAGAGGLWEQGKVVVLVDGETASAAEIVAAALQDNRRAQLVGQTTFGKGLVQDERVLRDGSRLRLTTAVYLTPKKRNIQRLNRNGESNDNGGIRPNRVVSMDSLNGPHWLASVRSMPSFDALTFAWAEQDRRRGITDVWVSDDRLWFFLETERLADKIDAMTEQELEWIRFALTLSQVRYQKGEQAWLQVRLSRDYAVDTALSLLL